MRDCDMRVSLRRRFFFKHETFQRERPRATLTGFAPRTEFAGDGVTAQAQAGGSFGAAALGELQCGFEQGFVQAFARFGVQALGAFAQALCGQLESMSSHWPSLRPLR